MRSWCACAFLAAVAACAAAPVLEDELTEDAGGSRRRLLVVNDAPFPVSISVNGTEVARLAPRSTAELDVGRSAGPRTRLAAAGPGVRVERTVSKRPWRLIWVLHGRN